VDSLSNVSSLSTSEAYKNKGWIGWVDFLGYEVVEFLPFENARQFVHSLGLKSRAEWRKWCESGKRPKNIPSHPYEAYKNKGWIGWVDFLGYEVVEFLPYEQAKEFMHNLRPRIRSGEAFYEWSASGKRPKNIPGSPSKIYKNKGWVNWHDWLGTRNEHRKDFLSYEEAKEYVQAHSDAKNQEEYIKWCISGKKPNFIPNTPYSVYENEGWIGYADWLGSKLYTKYWSFEKAREYVRKLGLDDLEAYKKWHKSENPEGIPRAPDKKYKDEGWVNWYDWLGTEYWPFEKAREYVRKLGLTSVETFKKWLKSEQKPKGMPADVSSIYKNKGWVDWGDFSWYRKQI
jgi:hypothetical protein